MWFIGDVHGEFQTYLWVVNEMQLSEDRGLSNAPDLDDMPASVAINVNLDSDIKDRGQIDCSLQVGDMGILNKDDAEALPFMRNHKFLRGNHDNPSISKEHPNCIGDVVYFYDQDMFVLSGALSVLPVYDKNGKKCLWEDEELSEIELRGALEYYGDSKPKIMVSHDCPTVVKDRIVETSSVVSDKVFSRTEKYLEEMFRIHKPDIWIFGHHHRKLDIMGEHTGGVRFICLNEMKYGPIKECLFEIPGLRW